MAATRVRVRANGRFVIPLEYRRSLGIESGGEVLVRLVDGELRIAMTGSTVHRAQHLFRTYVPEGTPVVEDFLRERRESAREEP